MVGYSAYVVVLYRGVGGPWGAEPTELALKTDENIAGDMLHLTFV